MTFALGSDSPRLFLAPALFIPVSPSGNDVGTHGLFRNSVKQTGIDIRAARNVTSGAIGFCTLTNERDFPVPSYPRSGNRHRSATMGSANSHQLTRKGKSWPF